MRDDRNMEKEAMCLFLIFITLLFLKYVMYTGRCGTGAGRHMVQIKYFVLTSYTKFCILWNMMIDA